MGFKLRSSGLPFKQMGSSPAKQQKKDEPGKYHGFDKGGAPVEPFNWDDTGEKEKVNWTQEYLKGGQKGLTGRAAMEKGTSINPDQKEVTKLQDKYLKSSNKKDATDKTSATPYKESPAKQTKSKSSWDIGGYLKGEQGFIPDYKGESTKKTVNKVAKKVVKATEEKPKGIKKLALKQSVKTEPGKTHSDIDAESMKKEGKLVEKKYMAVKRDLKPGIEKKETTAERNKRIADKYVTPAGAR